MSHIRLLTAALLIASPAFAQTTNDPFPTPIPAADGVVKAQFTELATLPDVDGEAARMMLLVDEPGTHRLFVSDMKGLLYSVSFAVGPDGRVFVLNKRDGTIRLLVPDGSRRTPVKH